MSKKDTLLSLNDLLKPYHNSRYKFKNDEKNKMKITDRIKEYKINAENKIDPNDKLFNPTFIDNLESTIESIYKNPKDSEPEQQINKKIDEFILKSINLKIKKEKKESEKKEARESKCVTKKSDKDASHNLKVVAMNEAISKMNSSLESINEVLEDNEKKIEAIKKIYNDLEKEVQEIGDQDINIKFDQLKENIELCFFKYTTKGKITFDLLTEYNNTLITFNVNGVKILKEKYSKTYDKIKENIGSSDDYKEKIQSLISNLNRCEKTLIIDHENLNSSLINIFKFKENTFFSNSHGKDDDLISNIDEKSGINYVSNTLFLILNYSIKNNYKNIFIVLKENIDHHNRQFKEQIQSFIDDKYINLKKENNKYLENVDQLNINILYVDKLEFASRIDDEVEEDLIHKIKGNDDAVIVLLLNELIKKYNNMDIKILTRDNKLFEDFINNQQFIPSFKVIVEKFDNSTSTFHINFIKDIYILDSDITILNSNIINYNEEIINYNYNTSKLDVDGKYEVKNFYNDSDSSKKTYENISIVKLDELEKLESICRHYIEGNEPILNDYKMPYLDHNGHIATLVNNPDIPYVSIYEKWKINTLGHKTFESIEFKPATKYTLSEPYKNRKGEILEIFIRDVITIPYCSLIGDKYKPALKDDGKPYTINGKIFRLSIRKTRDNFFIMVPYCYWANGKYHATLKLKGIEGDYYKKGQNYDTIIIQNWQPWYNKYLKYKQKYLLLKKNYYLEK